MSLADVPLVPFPASVRTAQGAFLWRSALTAWWSDGGGPEHGAVLRALARAGAQSRPANPAARGVCLTIGASRPMPCRPPSSSSPEAYRLRIGSGGIGLAANHAAGLFRGWQTLRQILDECGATLPAGEIDDAPALQLRGIHVDLKGLKPTPEYLLALPERLARLKINAILLELEDCVVLPSHPDIAHPAALPPEFWRRFARRAGDRHIEIIPLLQTWGHLHYILRHPRYRRLAEAREGMMGEICPLHPNTWPLLLALMDDLCAIFPESRRLHIGMDEVHARGRCPRCRRRVAEIGLNAFVIERLNERFDAVAARGRIPMFWGSVDNGAFTAAERALIRNPVTVQRPDGALRIRAIGCSGNYGMTGPEGIACSFRGGLAPEGALRKEAGLLERFPDSSPPGRTVADLDAAGQALARRHVLSPDGARVKPGYGIDILRSHGFDAVAISAAQYSAGVMGLCPDFVQRQRNEQAIAEWAKARGALGIIDTWWARGHSNVRNNAPFEAAWYGICSTADFAWRPAGQADIADFDRRWARAFLGLPDSSVTDALYAFSMSARRAFHGSRDFTGLVRKAIGDARRRATRNGRFLDVVDLGMEAHQLALRLQGAQLEAEYLFATLELVPAGFLRDCRKRLRELDGALLRLAARMRRMLARSVAAADIEELVAAQVRLPRIQIRHIGSLLTPARPGRTRGPHRRP